MAFEKLPVPQTVVEGSLNRAREMGRSAGFIAVRQLKPYTGAGEIFSEEQLASYAQRKNAEAASRYLEERITGMHNDKASKKPGLTALIRTYAKERMESVFVEQQGNLFAVEFQAVKETTDDKQLFTVRMPEGGFVELSEMTLEFSDVVEQVADEWVRPTASATTTIKVAALDVVTIAGDAGEYWQNPHFNLDGTY